MESRPCVIECKDGGIVGLVGHLPEVLKLAVLDEDVRGARRVCRETDDTREFLHTGVTLDVCDWMGGCIRHKCIRKRL